MHFKFSATMVLILALAGCSASPLPTSAPSPTPSGGDVKALVEVCGNATMINGAVLDADYLYAVDQSITANDWLARIADAKEKARELAAQNDGKPYAEDLQEYAEWVEGIEEVPPAEMTARTYNEIGAPLLYSACEAGGAGYGAFGVTGGGAVGG